MKIDVPTVVSREVIEIRAVASGRFDLEELRESIDAGLLGLANEKCEVALIIDPGTGRIKNLPDHKGTDNICLKVCDSGTYMAIFEKGMDSVREGEYVPAFFPEGHGDYWEFNVVDGIIQGWTKNCTPKRVAEFFFPKPTND